MDCRAASGRPPLRSSRTRPSCLRPGAPRPCTPRRGAPRKPASVLSYVPLSPASVHFLVSGLLLAGRKERHTEVLQDVRDLVVFAGDRLLELCLELLVALAHAHRDVEREPGPGVGVILEQHDLERRSLLLREVARDRPPRQREIG